MSADQPHVATQHSADHGRSAVGAVPVVPRRPGDHAEHRPPGGRRRELHVGLLEQPALRARSVRDDERTAQLEDRRIRQCLGVPGERSDLRPPSARRRLSDVARRQDALRRPRPVARLRGASHHRHLPGRLRMDAELVRPRRSFRLVVPQHGLRGPRRDRRRVEPARLRRRRRLPVESASSAIWPHRATSVRG